MSHYIKQTLIKVTLRQMYKSERMTEKKTICKHKNTGLVMVPAKPRVTLFCSMVFLYRWASFVANTIFSWRIQVRGNSCVFKKKINDVRNDGWPEKDLVNLFKELRSVLSKSKYFSRHLNFHSDTFSREDLKNLTGNCKKKNNSRIWTMGSKHTNCMNSYIFMQYTIFLVVR